MIMLNRQIKSRVDGTHWRWIQPRHVTLLCQRHMPCCTCHKYNVCVNANSNHVTT